MGRRNQAIGALLAVATACGGDSDTAPDAPREVDAASPTDITIKVFPDGVLVQGRTANATLVGVQDGDGAWQPLTGTGGVYQTKVTGPRYAVAVACAGAPDVGLGATVSVYAQTLDDTTDVRAEGCYEALPRAHLIVEVEGLVGAERGEVWIGSDVGFATAGNPVEVDVPKGPTDLFVRKRIIGNSTPLAVYRAPSLDIRSDQTVRYDLAVVGRAPESHALMFTRAAGETYSVHSSYAPAFYTGVSWPVGTEEPGAITARYLTIPAADRKPGDISNVSLFGRQTVGDRTDERSARFAMSSPVELDLALPPPLALTAPTLDATPLRRATVTMPIRPGTLGIVDHEVSLSSSDADGIPLVSWHVRVSPAWSPTPDTLTITTPDLSALPGWSADFVVRAGPVQWAVSRSERTLPYHARPTDGRKILSNNASGTLP